MVDVISVQQQINELNSIFENISIDRPPSLNRSGKMPTIYRTEKFGEKSLLGDTMREGKMLVKLVMTQEDYVKFLHHEIAERNFHEKCRAMNEMRGRKGAKETKKKRTTNDLLASMKEATKNMSVNLKTGEIQGHRTSEEPEKWSIRTGKQQTKKRRRRRKKKKEAQRRCQNWIVGMPKPS